MEVLLIDPTYLKRYTPINGQVDEDKLPPAIIAAQDIHLQLYLGSDLLDALKTKAQAGTLTGAYETLTNDYVRKALAWFTVVELVGDLQVQIRNGGLMTNTPEGSTAISPDEAVTLREYARSKGEFYLAQMCRYLSNNSSSLPEYSTNTQNRISARMFQYTQAYQVGGGGYASPLNELFTVWKPNARKTKNVCVPG